MVHQPSAIPPFVSPASTNEDWLGDLECKFTAHSVELGFGFILKTGNCTVESVLLQPLLAGFFPRSRPEWNQWK